MKISKILPNKTLPLALAAMTCIGINLHAGQNQDKYEKTITEPKKEITTEKNSDDSYEKGFPWLNVITGGIVLIVFGLGKLGEHLDKKIDEEEARKKEKNKTEETNTQA